MRGEQRVLDLQTTSYRACIGRRFAQLELYMMMVKVVQRFQLQYTGEKVGILTKFVSVPDTDVNIRFTKR